MPGRGFGRGRFRLNYGLRLGLTVRDARGLGSGRGPVFGRSFVFSRQIFVALMAVVAAKLEDHLVFEGTGVRLFIRDAEFGELLQYFVSFDF
jgi:hypothetical protein